MSANLNLIPAPNLDNRTAAQIAAIAIARTSSGVTVDILEQQIAARRELIKMKQSGIALPEPVTDELTNANPSSPHTVLVETFAVLCEMQAFKINQIPVQTRIAFANLFPTGIREMTSATTTLRFTVLAPPGQEVVILQGTRVSLSAESSIVFATDVTLIIPADAGVGDVAATRTTGGRTLLSPNTLTTLIDEPAFVTAVTNPALVDSGTDAETVASALARAVSYQQRAERLVSKRDIESALVDEVMLGGGMVKVFPFVRDGAWTEQHAGETTIILMTLSGNAVSQEIKDKAERYLTTAIGNQWFYFHDPEFVDVSVTAQVIKKDLYSLADIIVQIEANLSAIYAPRIGNAGRRIARSEIIFAIEAAEGVDRIASDVDGPILTSPAADSILQPYQWPRLVAVQVTAVNP